jgi:glycosyltransferase involved in cell wall biosynthesis
MSMIFEARIYGIASEKIDVIPHGIPDIPFVDPNFNKDQFGVEGKTVLLTFGLLSPNKGIEYVIEALSAILAQHPNVVYIILGATHRTSSRAKANPIGSSWNASRRTAASHATSSSTTDSLRCWN